MHYLLSFRVPVEHPAVMTWNNRCFRKLDYYKHLLQLVLDTDKILQSFVALGFISAEEQQNITFCSRKDRRTAKFLNVLIDKLSDDWSAVIAALQICQQFQVSQIILKIRTIITRLKGNNESLLPMKTLLHLKVRLNTVVEYNEHFTELTLFHWSTTENFQHNQVKLISDCSRTTIIGELNTTKVIMNKKKQNFLLWLVNMNMS